MRTNIACHLVQALVLVSMATLAAAPAGAQCQVDAFTPVFDPAIAPHEQSGFSMSGDSIAVAAVRFQPDDGQQGIYVFVEQGGDWVQEAFLSHWGNWMTCGFGYRYVLDGDTLAVGAPFEAPAGQPDVYAGAVFIYRRTAGLWSLEQRLDPDVPVTDQQGFGAELALEGDTLIVGELRWGWPYAEPGKAHVYVREGDTWTKQAVLAGSSGSPGNHFGHSLALQGDRLAVGAPAFTWPPSGPGEVYLFERAGDTWTETRRLLADDPVQGAHFGNTLALSGDSLAVSTMDTPPNQPSSSYVYVFVKSGGDWSQQAKLPPGGPAMRGSPNVVLHGDRLLVGDSNNEDAGSFAGAVHLFTRTEGVWMETDRLYGDDTAFEDGFGSIDWDGGLAALGSAETIYFFSLDDPNCPRAQFVASPPAGLPPLPVAFTDQSTGNVTSWQWSFGDGASDSAQHPSHTYLESGRYNVSLVARSAYGVHREIDAFHVLTFASATVRNGSGMNDLCYASTSLPLVGGTWTAEVDASAHAGASLTFLLAHLRPIPPRATHMTPWGEILILLSSPRIVGVTAVPDGAGIARYSLPIPSDLALDGFALATQAGILGSIELCNAVDLVLGF